MEGPGTRPEIRVGGDAVSCGDLRAYEGFRLGPPLRIEVHSIQTVTAPSAVSDTAGNRRAGEFLRSIAVVCLAIASALIAVAGAALIAAGERPVQGVLLCVVAVTALVVIWRLA